MDIKLTKGMKVKITDNSIFEMMGLQIVTGTILTVLPNGKGLAIKCDQTDSIEGFDFGDGLLIIEE